MRAEPPREKLPRLARVHAGHDAERQPRPGRLDDLVGGAEERARLEGDDGERRTGPQLLVDREALVAAEPHAGQHPGFLSVLGFVEWKPADAAKLLGAGLDDFLVEAGHVEQAVVLREAGDQLAEDLDGIGNGAAPPTAVQRLLEAGDLDVHLANAA